LLCEITEIRLAPAVIPPPRSNEIPPIPLSGVNWETGKDHV
jgi:hypothetical protein